MNSIDDYIQMAEEMKSTSDGGSVAYHFQDVCLIKYTIGKKYGPARKSAEVVSEIANRKNGKGVRTPKHLGIKRLIVNENDVCYVLQERAKGENFRKYTDFKDINAAIEMKSRLANAPDSHYEQLIRDFCELFHLGIELKPKNIFYDESIQDGGFTIIDLEGGTEEPLDSNSLEEVLEIYPWLRFYIFVLL